MKEITYKIETWKDRDYHVWRLDDYMCPVPILDDEDPRVFTEIEDNARDTLHRGYEARRKERKVRDEKALNRTL